MSVLTPSLPGGAPASSRTRSSGEALDAAEIAWRQGLGIEVEYPYPQPLTAWDRLYDMLRGVFPAAHYHGAKQLVAVEERCDGIAARFADGSIAGEIC